MILLPKVFPRHLSHFDKQHMLMNFASLACNAAAAIIQSGEGGIRSFESFRAWTWGHFLPFSLISAWMSLT